MRRSVAFRLMALAAVAVLAFVACSDDGGDDDAATTEDAADTEDTGDTGDTGGGGTLAVSAVDNSYDPNTLSAAAGSEVTIELTNDGANPHTFTIEGLADTGTVDPGSTGTATFTMPDEETTWQCAIHGAAMSGTLTPE